VEGSRVKATPVAEFWPLLPKTIVWTFTAVPSRPRMSFNSRYLIARGLFQEPNTALMPRVELLHGSGREGLARGALTTCLVALDTASEVIGGQLGVELDAGRFFFRCVQLVFEVMVRHAHDDTSPNIWMKRR
jgi:hypothetical protein